MSIKSSASSKTVVSLKRAAIVAMLCQSSNVMAQEYQSFSTLTFHHNRASFSDGFRDHLSSQTLSTRYYLDDNISLGPLSEFNYLNNISNFTAALNHSDGSEDYFLGGDYINQGWLIGGDYQTNNDIDSRELRLGYFVSNNVLVTFKHAGANADNFDFKNRNSLVVNYVNQLDSSDYFGLTYEYESAEINTHFIAGKYLTELGEDRYLAITGNLLIGEGDYNDGSSVGLWELGSIYHFNAYTNVKVSSGEFFDDQFVDVGAQHFFNENASVELKFSNTDRDFVSIDETMSANFKTASLSFSYRI